MLSQLNAKWFNLVRAAALAHPDAQTETAHGAFVEPTSVAAARGVRGRREAVFQTGIVESLTEPENFRFASAPCEKSDLGGVQETPPSQCGEVAERPKAAVC